MSRARSFAAWVIVTVAVSFVPAAAHAQLCNDFDGDGWMDVLSGSDNPGSWHLYRNTSPEHGASGQWLTVRVGSSAQGTDAFGATVTLLDEDDKPIKYQIVGQTEADASQGRISYNSPIGKALIGRKVGDEIEVTVPAGDKFYLIEKLEFV